MGRKPEESPQEEWRQEYIEKLARNIREYRDVLGISAQQLSDRTERVGFKIPRSSIANIETSSKRSYPIHELVTLAAAFGVPLTSLLASPYRATELIRPLATSRPTPAYQFVEQGQIRLLDNWGVQKTEVTRAVEAMWELSDAYSFFWEIEQMQQAIQRLRAEGQQRKILGKLRLSLIENDLETVEDVVKELKPKLQQLGVEWWAYESHVVPPDIKRRVRNEIETLRRDGA